MCMLLVNTTMKNHIFLRESAQVQVLEVIDITKHNCAIISKKQYWVVVHKGHCHTSNSLTIKRHYPSFSLIYYHFWFGGTVMTWV